MRRLPFALIEFFFGLPFIHRPRFLSKATTECPSAEELRRNLIFLEIRDGYQNWAHFSCPRCGDHIQLPRSVKIDFLGRPTFVPSIWETESCGAHFFVKKGQLHWCQ